MSRLSERKVREIARRLGESPSYGPPPGLLEKIKSEIPPEVTVGSAFNAKRSAAPRQWWLIAASLVAVVGAGLVGLRTWEAREQRGLEQQAWRQVAAAQSPAAPQGPAAQRPAAQSPAAPEPVQPARPSAFQRLSLPPPPPSPPARLPSEEVAGAPAAQEAATPEPELRKDFDSFESRLEQAAPAKPQARPENLPAPAAAAPRAEREVEDGVVGGVAGGAPAGAPDKARTAQAAGEVQALAESSPLLDARRQQAKAEKKPHSGAAFNLQPAGADPFVDAAAYRFSTFGLNVGTASFAAARRDLLAGHLPDPASVRVEEWVNSFDYGDPAPAEGDFAIRAEGAPSPLAHGSERRLLRFSVKARQARAGGLADALVARNAGVQVEFNPVVVARYRLLGYEDGDLPGARSHDERDERDEKTAGEPISAGHGVTALYEIELRPNAPRWEQPVATLRLYYREAGTRNTAQKLQRVGFQSFAPTWEQASPGLRLASLVAELAEALQGAPWTRGDDLGLVARRIQEVAHRFPKLTELADLAARAARLKAREAP